MNIESRRIFMYRLRPLGISIASTVLLLAQSSYAIAPVSANSLTIDDLSQTPSPLPVLPVQPPMGSSPKQPTLNQPPLNQPSSSWSEDYVLGAGDQVQVEVFRIPDYGGDFEVLVGGVLNLPMVGEVLVGGLTLAEAEAAIASAYSRRLRRPIISLSLINPRPLRIGIAGEVTRPGVYTVQREGTQFPSLSGALEIAGGVTRSANLRQIRIQRARSSTPENTRLGNSGQRVDSAQTVTADLWAFLQTGDLGQDFILRDGDTIFVPTQESFNRDEALQIATSSFAADEARPLNIAIVGEVFRPGPYTVTGTARTGEAGLPGGSGSSPIPPTVTRAIQVAGGIRPEANIREIDVYRRTRTGQTQVIRVDLWKLIQSGDIAEDIVLQEGDTISVPQADQIIPEEIAEIAAASFSPDSIRINVVGEVDQPGLVEVSPNTPLSQGVLAAGGFNNRATRGFVELIRLNSDGTVTQSAIEIDFSKGIDEDQNPLLRNNDIIVVNRSASASLADTLDAIASPLTRVLSIFTLPAALLDLLN